MGRMVQFYYIAIKGEPGWLLEEKKSVSEICLSMKT